MDIQSIKPEDISHVYEARVGSVGKYFQDIRDIVRVLSRLKRTRNLIFGNDRGFKSFLENNGSVISVAHLKKDYTP